MDQGLEISPNYTGKEMFGMYVDKQVYSTLGKIFSFKFHRKYISVNLNLFQITYGANETLDQKTKVIQMKVTENIDLDNHSSNRGYRSKDGDNEDDK